jgi:adenosine deaminase
VDGGVEQVEAFIRGLPKAELHIHLEGSLEPEMLFELADRNRVAIRFDSVEQLRSAYRFSDLQSFLDLYYEGVSVLVRGEDFRDLTRQYTEHAWRDNVRHVEVFFDPQVHTDRGIAFETVVGGIHEALASARREHGITSRLIMCFVRHLSQAEAITALEQALPFRDQIAGVGLDSSELGHPPSKFVDVFARARAEGFHVVAHAGEEGPPEYIRQALDQLGAERIDHGVRAMEDPDLVRRLVHDRIPLTVCPLSNVKLGVFPSMRAHNLRQLLDAGLLVTLNSDDPAYFGGYLVDNYLAAQRALDLDRNDIHRIAANGFEASFLEPAEIAALHRELDDYSNRH